MIHSPDLMNTLQTWRSHLAPGGVILVIDDFLASATMEEHEEVALFRKGWMANALFTQARFREYATALGFSVVHDSDVGLKYDVAGLNYRGKIPEMPARESFQGEHQGWVGARMRGRLTVRGEITYRMFGLRKGATECAAVPTAKKDSHRHKTVEVALHSGKQKNMKQACISSWYCCGIGTEWFDAIEANRTNNYAFLKTQRSWFGHYTEVMVRQLNKYYATLPADVQGKFIDIGATGNTKSGMQRVVSKFEPWAGPLEYWQLDMDSAARGLPRTLVCNVEDCPAAQDCEYDVTFSHTVLEHAKRPWDAFDTIARITKKGGLTLHLVPWSYQWHATPADNYRFSREALIDLFEDRGFEILEVGYDICEKPKGMRQKIDEHYDKIWLTYVVAKKL